MFGRPKAHYHVSTISGQISVPGVVTEDEVTAMLEWDKMVQYVRQQIGMDVKETKNNEARFFDGTIVRYKKCHGHCLA